MKVPSIPDLSECVVSAKSEPALTVLPDRSVVVVHVTRYAPDGNGHVYSCPQWHYNWRAHDYSGPAPVCTCPSH